MSSSRGATPRSVWAGSSGGAPAGVPKLALPPSSSRGVPLEGGSRPREFHSARPGSSGTHGARAPLPPHQPSTARPATSGGVARRPLTGRVILADRPATAAHAPTGGLGRLHQPQGHREGSVDLHAQDSARPWTGRTSKSTARSIISGKIRRDITAPSEKDKQVWVQPDPRWKGLYGQHKKEMKEAADLDREYEKAMLGYSGKKVSRARLDFNLFCLEKQGVIPPPPDDRRLWMSSPMAMAASSIPSSPEHEQPDVGLDRRTAR